MRIYLLFILLFMHIVFISLAYIQFFRWYNTPGLRANIVVSHVRTPDDRAIHSSATRITIHRRLAGGVGAINMKRVAYTRYLIRVMWRRDATLFRCITRRARRGKSAARVEASLTRAKIHSPRYIVHSFICNCGRTKIPYTECPTGCPFSHRFLDGFSIEFP